MATAVPFFCGETLRLARYGRFGKTAVMLFGRAAAVFIFKIKKE